MHQQDRNMAEININEKIELKEEFLGVNLAEIGLLSAGVAFSETVANQLTRFIPQLGTDVAKIVAGLALNYLGNRIHPYVSIFGKGVLIEGVAEIIKRFVVGGAVAVASPAPVYVPPTPVKEVLEV